MRTVDIKGKKYVEVSERIKYFRENYKDYSLETEVVKIEDGICVLKAIIKDDSLNIIATGLAYEKEGSSFINKTSYIENCETSAWGRALGNLGIGIDAGVASADDMKRVKSQTELDLDKIKSTQELQDYYNANKEKQTDKKYFNTLIAIKKEDLKNENL